MVKWARHTFQTSVLCAAISLAAFQAQTAHFTACVESLCKSLPSHTVPCLPIRYLVAWLCCRLVASYRIANTMSKMSSWCLCFQVGRRWKCSKLSFCRFSLMCRNLLASKDEHRSTEGQLSSWLLWRVHLPCRSPKSAAAQISGIYVCQLLYLFGTLVHSRLVAESGQQCCVTYLQPGSQQCQREKLQWGCSCWEKSSQSTLYIYEHSS